MTGTPMQIYHPDSDCQYILIGLFNRVSEENYEFISLNRVSLDWIERVVWPKKLFYMGEKIIEIMNNT